MQSYSFEIATENSRGEWLDKVEISYFVEDGAVYIENISYNERLVTYKDLGLKQKDIQIMAEHEASKQYERNKRR